MCGFWSLLFTQEINVKEQTFEISSSSSLWEVMKPITSQDMKWTRLQMTRGPKHQHVKLRGLGGLPKISTQSERYSRSPEQHDLSVQIQRLKRSLMAKVWLPKLWTSTIALIWTYGMPNSGQGARRCSLWIASYAGKSEIRQIIFRDCFGILSSFLRKSMSTKVDDNFVAQTWTPNLHYLKSGRRRYGAGKEELRIRKIWTRLILWKQGLLLSQGGSRARQGVACPKAPQ
jgi:hypothetical protein